MYDTLFHNFWRLSKLLMLVYGKGNVSVEQERSAWNRKAHLEQERSVMIDLHPLEWCLASLGDEPHYARFISFKAGSVFAFV